MNIHRIKATSKHTGPGRSFAIKTITAYSLVEMMIALLLSSAVMAALGFWYTDAKRSWLLADGHGHVMQNGRVALQVLTMAVQRAGYLHQPVPTFSDARYQGRDSVFRMGNERGITWNSVQVIGGRSALAPAIPGVNPATVDATSDVLIIRYQAVSRMTASGAVTAVNCAGNPVMDGDVVTEIYYIRRTADEYSLACQSLRPHYFNDQPSTLVQGVSALKILYGEWSPEAEVLAYKVDTSVIDWSAVKSLKIALRVGHATDIYGAERDPYEYSLLDPQVTYESQADHRLTTVYAQTIALRN